MKKIFTPVLSFLLVFAAAFAQAQKNGGGAGKDTGGSPSVGIDLVSIIIGLVIGLIIGYFLGKRSSKV